MGAILRLDGRVEIEDHADPVVCVVAATWWPADDKAASSGRIWPITPHVKPALRLDSWSKRKALRPVASSVVVGEGGVLDYHNLPVGLYEANSAATASRQLTARVVLEVKPGGGLDLVTRAAGTDDGRDLVVCRLSGWTPDRLQAEREAYAAELAAQCRAAGMVDLVGSPRQLVYCNRFRLTKYLHAVEYLECREGEAAGIMETGDLGAIRRHGEALVFLIEGLRIMATIEAADWWAPRCGVKGADIVRELARAAHRGQREPMAAGKGAL